MTQEDIIQWFSALSQPEQVTATSRIAHFLTISARDTYIPQNMDVAKPLELRGYNELQHQLLGHLNKLIDHDSARYPDDVLIRVLVEIAALHHISRHLEHAIRYVQNWQESYALPSK